MTKISKITAPAARVASDQDVAKAMRSLEDLVNETRMTSVILDEFLDYELEASWVSQTGHYDLTGDQRDKILFLTNRVRELSFSLQHAFEAAWNGEVRT